MAKRVLDDKDWKLIEALQQDARSPLKTLAQAIGLSVPATAERVKRLEADGVIRGYRAEIDIHAAGYAVSAILAITVAPSQKVDFLAALERMPEVLECHHVTGADSYLFTLVASSIPHLEKLIGAIVVYGDTRTSIIMSSPIPRRAPRAVNENGA